MCCRSCALRADFADGDDLHPIRGRDEAVIGLVGIATKVEVDGALNR